MLQKKPIDTLLNIRPKKLVTLPPFGVVLNKMDLIPLHKRTRLIENIKLICGIEPIFGCSSLKQLGVQTIKNWIVTRLPFSPNLYPQEFVADRPESFFVSELIREKIFELFRQELPYCCQVNVVEFSEKLLSRKNHIYAEIWVEKASQAKILIGRNGSMIRQLLSKSRQSIEEFLDRSVYLSVRIKVRQKWRKNSTLINKLDFK